MRAALALLIIAALSPPALAHTGAGSVSGFATGFAHPFGGADHLLAMVAVGAWAAQIGKRAVWLVPTIFATVMTAGGIVGLLGSGIGGTESLIVASVLVLGAVVAAALRPPLWIAAPIVGAFAFFHGVAHGAELPTAANATGYVLGFLVATILLHVAGLGLAAALQRAALGAVLRGLGAAQICAGALLAVLPRLAVV